MSSVDSITITSVSTVNQITITDTSGITVTTVGTQGVAGPSAIMARGINQDTAGASNNGALLIYDNANVKWTANDTTEGKQLTQKLFNLQLGESGATVTTILDEDGMDSNSATALSTQQSIKAYVDAQVTLQDLDISDGSTTIAIDLDSETLGLLGGVGISSTASGNNVTFAIDATVVTLSGTQTLTNKTLTAPTLTSPVLNTSLSGSAFLDEDDMSSNSATAVATQQSIKAFTENLIAAQDLDIAPDSGTSQSILLPSETLTFSGGSNIGTSATSNTVTFAISDVVQLTASQTLTNKIFTSPTINTLTFASGQTTSGMNIGANGIIFEGATADAHETTLNAEDPTQDNTITIPNSTMTAITTATHATKSNHISRCIALG